MKPKTNREILSREIRGITLLIVGFIVVVAIAGAFAFFLYSKMVAG